jgi:hypothetical protein
MESSSILAFAIVCLAKDIRQYHVGSNDMQVPFTVEEALYSLTVSRVWLLVLYI